MQRPVPAITIFVFLAADVGILAHHGYAGFFDPSERTVAVEGTVEGLLYANPHVVMTIRVADSTLYTVTWQAATWLERNAGVSKSTFSVGDRLIIVGAPSRDPKSRDVTLVREVRRPRDGWRWRRRTLRARPERPAADDGRPSVFRRGEPLRSTRESDAAGLQVERRGFLIRSAAMQKLIAVVLLILLAACTSPAPEQTAAPSATQTLAPATVSAPQTGVAAAPEIIPVDQVRKSQEAAVTQRIANTDITVTYSRPVARGRELFGKLVPYDAVWNPGADKATSIEVTRDVQVNGQALPAGRYSMWAIPRADNWTLMFSRMADTFHATYPGEEQDALRLDVKPEPGPHMEVLSFYFPLVEGKEATLRLHWGTTMVPLVVTVP